MHPVVEFPSDGVVPRQRFGPRSQLFMSTASEEGTETLVAHRQVVQDLEHVKQYGDRYGEQHQGLERVDHLEQQH